MGTLHTVNKSPFRETSLTSCLAHAKDGDTVLLIEDGIFGALKNTRFSDAIKTASAKVCILAPDIAARGISEAHILDGVQSVDYDGFVAMAAESDRIQAWL